MGRVKSRMSVINDELDILREKAEQNHFIDPVDKERWCALRAEQDKIERVKKEIAYNKACKNLEFRDIYTKAYNAGMKAGQEAIPTPMVVQTHANMLDDNSPVVQSEYISEGACGFAWVNVKPGYSKFAKWLKAMGYGDNDSYYKGVTVWVSEFGQSIARKEAFAHAFADVLKEFGIQAYGASRLD